MLAGIRERLGDLLGNPGPSGDKEPCCEKHAQAGTR
jgi:hypothetical protein